jgi:predicted dehydrogenase
MFTEKGMNKYKVAVIGLGNVGQLYDYKNSSKNIILTHCKAISLHPSFELVAGVDIDENNCKNFREKFAKPVFQSINELCIKHKPDVFVIASPTKTHNEIFHEIINYSPDCIILEKPIATNAEEAFSMYEAAKENNCMVLVNYSRRFNDSINNLKGIISGGQFGKILKGTVWYTKGIVENGTHFIDLLQYLLGDATNVEILNPGRYYNDVDPEPDICITFEDSIIYFLSGKEENFCMGQFELVGENGLIFYRDDNPIKIYFSEDDPVYDGYRVIKKQDDIINFGDKEMWYLYDSLIEYLVNGNIPVSTIDTAIKTLYITEEIKENYE